MLAKFNTSSHAGKRSNSRVQRSPSAGLWQVEQCSEPFQDLDLERRVFGCVEIPRFDQIERGEVRALLVYGGNPLSSFPDPERLSAALASLDVLAVFDVVATETVELATHALACTDALERADVPFFLDQFLAEVGSRYTPAVVEPKDQHRHAWQIFHALGERLDIAVLPEDVDPESVTEDELLARIAARARRFAALVAFRDVSNTGRAPGRAHNMSKLCRCERCSSVVARSKGPLHRKIVFVALYGLTLPFAWLLFVAGPGVVGALPIVMAIGTGPQNAAFQSTVPNHMRAKITATFLFMFTMGSALGPMVVSSITTYGFDDPSKLRYSLALTHAVLGPLAVFVFWKGLRAYGELYQRVRAQG